MNQIDEKAAWLEERRTGITGTDIAAICGLNKYRNAFNVWKDKLGQEPPIPENDKMLWGRLQEDLIAQFYSTKHGVALIDPGRYTLMRHPEIPYVVGTPDRLFHDDKQLLEIKTGSARTSKEWGEQGTDSIPESYLIQVQWYLLLTGRTVGHVAVKLDSYDYREYKVDRNDKLISKLKSIAAEFWERCILNKESPKLSPAQQREVYSIIKDSGEIKQLTEPRDIQALREYAEYDRLEKEYEAKKIIARTAIENMIGEAAGVEGGGYKVSWKQPKARRDTDWEALARFLAESYHLSAIELNEHIANHTTEKQGSRVFRFSNPKED